jgi:hypothetical protein
MINCLLTDLFTTSELKIYVIIRITQCSLIFEIKAIFIHLYYM